MSGEVADPSPAIERAPDKSRFEELVSLVTRNDRHHDRIDEIDTRISVSGTRGKSTLVRWLHDKLVEREFDTYAKITGDEPLSIYNGTEWVIPRTGRTTLYENETEIRRFFPMDAIVVENQGISPYTTRLVNTRYVRPQHVVIPNIREDHLDTLGGNRERITRALARSIPKGSHVICGEQAESVRSYFATEVAERDAEVTFVDVPEEFGHIPGAELVYCLDETLRAVTGEGLERGDAQEYLDEFRVDWQYLPEGRVYDASSVNDVQSTEAFRRALLAGGDELVQPLIYLRRDRPGRTASYSRYVDVLYERGVVEKVRVVDGHAEAFDARTDVPVVRHDDREEPAEVLEAALSDGWPVVLMGNATPDFMVEMRQHIDEAASAGPVSPGPQPLETTSLESVAEDAAQILVLDRDPPGETNGICSDLLTLPGNEAGMVVGLDRPVTDHIDEWAAKPSDARPNQLAFVSVGETLRSAAAATPSGVPAGSTGSYTTDLPAAPEGFGPVTAVEWPELGTAISNTLGELDADGEDVSVCVNSLGGLLDQRSLEDAFRTLHTLGRQLEASGVTAHYHMSTVGRHGHTVATLKPLFDVVITVNENGDSWVHR